MDATKLKDNKISNWRTDKNLAHWKFECTEKGLYSFTIIHSKVSKENQKVK